MEDLARRIISLVVVAAFGLAVGSLARGVTRSVARAGRAERRLRGRISRTISAVLSGALIGALCGPVTAVWFAHHEAQKPMGDPMEGLARMVVTCLLGAAVAIAGGTFGVWAGSLLVAQVYREKPDASAQDEGRG